MRPMGVSFLLGAFLVTTVVGAGCGRRPKEPEAPVEPFRGVMLTVGVIGDPKILATIAARRGEWEQTRGGEIVILDEPFESSHMQEISDVIVFQGEHLGDLIDINILQQLPDSVVQPPPAPNRSSTSAAVEILDADPLAYNEIVPSYREYVTEYGGERFALPFGGSALVLVYRLEAFENEANRSEAEQEGIPLEPPTTWDELDALARFLHGRDWNGDGAPDAGIALALGADSDEQLGLLTFLARAAALGQHRDYYSFHFDTDSMAPRVSTPPFVEALSALVALRADGPDGMDEFDAAKAREAFRSGQVALLIDRAELVHQWVDPEDDATVGVAQLPGSQRYYNPDVRAWEDATPVNRPSYLPHGGGWLIGVSATSRNPEAALDLARYLIESETASRVRLDRTVPMLPVRGSLILQGPPDPRAIPAVDRQTWSDAVSRTLMAAQVIPSLRIPDADDYLAELEQARLAVLAGEPAEAALQTAAGAWAERSKGLGIDRQKWHYRRSLNRLATSPEPPPRPSSSTTDP